MPAGSRPPAFYFSDAGQEVIVSASQVRAGAPDLPYTLASANVTVADGTSSYVGCQAYRNTTVSDGYTRPDGSTYTLAKGAGTPTGPVNVCVSTNVKTGPVAVAHWCSNPTSSGDSSFPGSFGSVYALLNKVQTKNTETGDILSTTCTDQGGSSTTDGGFSFYDCGAGWAHLIPASYITGSGGGTRYIDTSAAWPGSYTAAYGTACPAGF